VVAVGLVQAGRFKQADSRWGHLIAFEALPAVFQLDHTPGDPDTDDAIRSHLEVGQRDDEAMRAGTDLGVQQIL
jgi:hypothetical protein